MKIEALESIKSDGYVLDPEDVKTVPDEIGARWCGAGWARDMSGTIPTGERITLNAKLAVHPGVVGQTATVVGVN